MRTIIDSVFSRKYGGKVIYKVKDPHGIIEVVDSSNIRSLHFGSRPKQSSLDLYHPNRLCLEYAKNMMSGLLFNPYPEKCLVLGLGGGSIPRFLHYHYPELEIKSVEYREKVIDVAQRFFHLPSDNRFQIYNDSAESFVEKESKSKYDMIFTDIFNQDGMSKTLLNYDFFKSLKRKLDNDGILVINLWLRPERLFDKIISNINEFFFKKLILVPIIDRTNCIAIGINSKNPYFADSLMLDTANRLRKKLGVNFIEIYQVMAEYNTNFFYN